MLVSVFIPTYNASKCIDATLQSVLGQTYENLEVWLVDDKSTDDTVAKLEAWKKKDARVHVLAKEENEGFVPFSWNRVFPHLKGDFTLYMSHDDFLASNCIKLLVDKQQKTGADAVIPDCVFDYEDCRQVSSDIKKFKRILMNGKRAFAEMLNYDIPGFALWRTSLIRSIGMPTEAWNSDEGMQRIWALNCKHGVAFCPRAKFYYFITTASITKGLKPYHKTGLLTQKRLLKEALRNGIWFRYPHKFFRFWFQYLKSYVYLTNNL